ncbi:MAG: hypothetical protein LUD47_00465 [Clostridia bacterium]|nr:hypothetical protein [Clostridia bacterium]
MADKNTERSCTVEFEVTAEEARRLDGEAEKCGLDRSDFVMRCAEGKPAVKKNTIAVLAVAVANRVNTLRGLAERPGWTDGERARVKEAETESREYRKRLVKFGLSLGYRCRTSANRKKTYEGAEDKNAPVRMTLKLTPKEKEIFVRLVKKSGLSRRDFVLRSVGERTQRDADSVLSGLADFLSEQNADLKELSESVHEYGFPLDVVVREAEAGQRKLKKLDEILKAWE